MTCALSESLQNPARVTRPSEGDQTQWRCGESIDDIVEGKTTPIPKLQFSVLLYLQLAEPMTSTVILPFIVKLVEETGITGGDFSKVGYYAGFVESLFFLTEALMILQWGRISDIIGRRPVLLTGLFGLGISMLFFGLSHTFLAVIASRAIAGALNGNTGVLKCMMSEITDESNIARGFAFLPIMWSVGNTIGPLIGGLLQHPYERFGGAFGYQFWQNNPYFLPCLVSMSYSTSAFAVAYFLLKETAPSVIAAKYTQDISVKNYDSRNNMIAETQSTVQITERTALLLPLKPPTLPLRALLTPRVIVVILNYSLIALIDMAFIAIQPLFLSVPVTSGGLGMSPSMIGICLAAFGIANGIISVVFFARLERRFGTRNVFTACIAAYIGCYGLYPLMNALARAEGGLGPRVWFTLMIQLLLATLPSMAFSCVFVFLTAAAPSRSALGATTGLAQTTTSIMRAIAPAGASALFALSMEHNLLGGSLVYGVFCILAVFTVATSTLLPAKPWKRVED